MERIRKFQEEVPDDEEEKLKHTLALKGYQELLNEANRLIENRKKVPEHEDVIVETQASQNIEAETQASENIETLTLSQLSGSVADVISQ